MQPKMNVVYAMSTRGAGERHVDDGTGLPLCYKAIVNGWRNRITETAFDVVTCKDCKKLLKRRD